MQRSKIRLEIRGIMAAIAVSALILGVYRADVAPSVAVVLIVGSTSVLTYKVYSDLLTQAAREVQVITLLNKIALSLTAATVAVTFIGLSDVAFLAGYYGFVEMFTPFWTRYETDRQLGLEDHLLGACCGFISAMAAAYALKRTIWPIVTEPRGSKRIPPEE
jgi:hypothetical protein